MSLIIRDVKHRSASGLSAEIAGGSAGSFAATFRAEGGIEPLFEEQVFLCAYLVLNAVRGRDPWSLLASASRMDPAFAINASTLVELACAWWRAAPAPSRKLELMQQLACRATAVSPSGQRSTAAFFTGGIDSLFTLHRNLAAFPVGHPGRITDLIFAYGLDVGVGGLGDTPDQRRKYDELCAYAAMHARSHGLRLVTVETNVRYLDPDNDFYTQQNHSGYLAAIAHLFSGRYARVLIGSTLPVWTLHPWGSHPLVDALYADTHLAIVHDGHDCSRPEKIRFLYGALGVSEVPHVCVANELGRINCGRCFKCRRTQLEIHSVLGEVPEGWFEHEVPLSGLLSEFAVTSRLNAVFAEDTARAFDAAGNADAARRLRLGIRQWERAMARVEERDWRGPLKRALRRIGVKR